MCMYFNKFNIISILLKINIEIIVIWCDSLQQIEDNIQSSGGHRQCVCIPFDLHIGSAVKVTLASISDTDWPWEIPFDCTYKVWDQLTHFGSIFALTHANFRVIYEDTRCQIILKAKAIFGSFRSIFFCLCEFEILLI